MPLEERILDEGTSNVDEIEGGGGGGEGSPSRVVISAQKVLF